MLGPDAALEPPEENSWLVHTGAGPAPMQAAAAGYQVQVASDTATRSALQSLELSLQAQWEAQSAEAALLKTQQQILFYDGRIANGETSAAGAEAAAAALSAALTTTPHYLDVGRNRVHCAQAVSTNFFGFRTFEIVADNVEYGVMWGRAALGRGTLDSVNATSATSLMSWSPPSSPGNIAAAGGLVARAMGSAATGVASTVDGFFAAANSIYGDMLVGKAAIGDGVEVGQGPGTAPLTQADRQRGDGVNKLGEGVQKTGELGSQAGSMGGQMSGIISAVTQVPSQVASQGGQLLQAPMQGVSQFGSILQPLMSGGGLGKGLGDPASSAASGIGPSGFATGTGNLAASVTRPASFGGGGLGGGSAGLGPGIRLPASSLVNAAEKALAPAAGAAGGALAGGAGGGFMGAPMAGHGNRQGNKGTVDEYARAREFGPQPGGAPIE